MDIQTFINNYQEAFQKKQSADCVLVFRFVDRGVKENTGLSF